MDRPPEYADTLLSRIFDETRTIALVGASPDPARPSFQVMRYLQDRGYRVWPVNPRAAGGSILGETVRARLADLDEAVDMVDVFRASAAVGGVVDETLALAARPRVLWLQLGVVDADAAARAAGAGLTVVMDRCPKIEYGRLFGETARRGPPPAAAPSPEGSERR